MQSFSFELKISEIEQEKTMKISRKEFSVLDALQDTDEALSQRDLQLLTGYSLGTVNKVIKALTENGLAADGRITSKGLEALEPYRVKRAVFIAAGFGSRMVPVTLNTPKPLVRVNGKRIIDGLLDAVIAAGIEDIVIVRGYLAEQFDQLLYKYPMIRFLENPAYNEANNISSAMCARYLLENAYVFEADLLLRNPKLVKKYQYSSNFLGIKMGRTDDWCFTVKDGLITSQKIGGIDCYQEVGISYWDRESGRKLADHIKQSYEMPGGKERYWDQVVFVDFPKEYKVEIRECIQDDIVEIDTFNELKKIDKTYDV
jgi:CTP:phosphocholine cytidylyltransferase-like protein